jgi:hypothetical protein
LRSGGVHNLSRLTEASFDNRISKVNSKYERMRDPVKMEAMLSRAEQKTVYNLETPIPKNPFQRALDQYGYTKHNPELDHNLGDLRAKISPYRPDRCVFGFERALPREYRNSIYSANDGIRESEVVDKDRSLQGIEMLSTTKHDARPLHFRYEKEV